MLLSLMETKVHVSSLWKHIDAEICALYIYIYTLHTDIPYNTFVALKNSTVETIAIRSGNGLAIGLSVSFLLIIMVVLVIITAIV